MDRRRTAARALAGEVRVDGEHVVPNAREGTYRPTIDRGRELGVELDLQGVPQVYVNRERPSDHSYETVSPAGDAAL